MKKKEWESGESYSKYFLVTAEASVQIVGKSPNFKYLAVQDGQRTLAVQDADVLKKNGSLFSDPDNLFKAIICQTA